jgi:predicted phosphodiesterase
MKIIIIGDIHGLDKWQWIVANEITCDKIVFVGDYFDSLTLSATQQKHNFKNIVEFKKTNPDKVILLFGNHDFHYLSVAVNEQYSGFQYHHMMDIQQLLNQAINDDIIQMCFKYDNLLMTHAGVTKTWCKNKNVDIDNIDTSINDIFKFTPKAFKFTMGKYFSPYGDDVEQSPIWVRLRSLLEDKVDGYKQIVGHTQQHGIDISGNVIIVDALDVGEYLIYEDSKFRVGKII